MSRLEGIRGEPAADVARVLQAQTRRYGNPLFNHLVLARRPDIFRGFRSMWDGIDASALLPAALLALINLRVASLLGCGL